jgi:uncharacterized protein DUF4397
LNPPAYSDGMGVRRGGIGAVGLSVLLTGAWLATPSQAADDAQLYLVQGLPNRTVDVEIDGDSVADGVAATKVAGPFDVSAGSHTVRISDGDETVVEKTVKVGGGDSMDVVAHLPAPGETDPVITAYDNDLAAVPSDKANLTVAHTAEVPPADVTVNGKVLFADIANGEALSLVVPVGTYETAIVPHDKDTPVYLGPLKLTVEGGALNRVYAVGDPEKKTMNVAVHVIEVQKSGSKKPDKVDTGTGGQAAGLESGREPVLWVDLTR